jgi:hypothetical protein
VHHDLEDENDVYACMPLSEDDFKPSEGNDQGIITFLSICYANTLVL